MTDVFNIPIASRDGVLSNGTAWSVFGQGQPVVLIHGVGMSQEFWAPQVHGLMNDAQVFTYDMWGHGKTPANNLATTLEAFTQQLLELIDGLDLDQVHVVGHSMGGLVALDFAIRHATRCASVTVLNAVFNRTEEQRAPVLRRAQLLQTDGTMNIDATLERWFDGNLTEKPALLSRRLLSQVNPQGYANAYLIFATADDAQDQAIRTLEVPAVFATGDGDPNSTPSMSEEMAALAPLGHAEIIHGHRHMMSLTAPEVVTTLIHQQLMQHPISARSRS